MSRLTLPTRTLISLLAVASFAPLAHAQSAASADQQRVEELEQRLLVLERKLEIQTEEAATKAKEAPVVNAGDKGFSLKNAKGDYEIKFSGLAQIDGRYFIDDDGAFRDGFIARRLRPTVQGNLGKLVSFRFTPEFAGNGTGEAASIVDAYFDLKFSPAASIRAGKQKGLLGLERLQSGAAISLVERGYATELVPNRDLGVALYGELASSTINYAVGVFNGTADGRDVVGTTTGADDGLKEFEGRVFFEPFKNDYSVFKGLGVGIAGSTGAKDGSGNNFVSRYRSPGQNQFFTYEATAVASGKHTRYAPQGFFYRNNVGLLAEYVVSEQDLTRGGVERSIKNDGYNVTASYVLTGEDASYRGVKPSSAYAIGAPGWGAVELVARIGGLSVDNAAFAGVAATDRLANPTAQASKAESYGAGINWYLTQNAKLTADYNYTSFEGGGGGTAAAPIDRRDEKAVFTRLTIQY